MWKQTYEGLVVVSVEESVYAMSVMLSRTDCGREGRLRATLIKAEKREENIKNWIEWIPGVLDEMIDRFDDSEVYLVGSAARGEAGYDVDLLILTDKAEKHMCS